MLILAGVSLNAVIGDNGIITQAQNATYMQSIAVLEEYLNSFYVEHYEEFENVENKAEALEQHKESSNWIWNPAKYGYGAIGYVVNADGNACYFINKEGLPEEIRKNIKGGDAGEGKYTDYANMNDVYGVTSNLKVYYSKNGKDNMLGISSQELDNEDPNREIYPAGSAYAKLITGVDDKNVTAKDVKSIKSLTIDSSSGINSFKELYNLTSLQEITLKDLTIDSLEGIQNATQLNYISIQNCKINDFSAIADVKKLKSLYLLQTNNLQIASIMQAMSVSDYTELKNIGIYDNTTNVTRLEGFDQLSEVTKNSIENLYLYNNNLESIEELLNFKNVKYISVSTNKNLTTLKGLDNMEKLEYINASSCNLGANEVFDTSLENNGKNSQSDALTALVNIHNLKELRLNDNNNLKWIGYINNEGNFDYLYLSNCESFVVSEVSLIKNIYNNSINKNIDGKFLKYLNTSEIYDYTDSNLEDDSEEILALQGLPKEEKEQVKVISFNNNPNLSNEKINEILSSGFTNIFSIRLNGCTNLTSLDFLEYTESLRELCISNTSVGNTESTASEFAKIDKFAKNLDSLSLTSEYVDIQDIKDFVIRCSEELRYSNFYSNSMRYNVLSAPASLTKQLGNITGYKENFRILGLANYSGVIDMTNCTTIKNITLDSSYTMILPSSLVNITDIQSSNKNDISNCKELTKINFNPGYSTATIVENYFKQIYENSLKNIKNIQVSRFPREDNYGNIVDYLKYSNIETLSLIDYNKNDSKLQFTANFDFNDNIQTEEIEFGNLKNLTIQSCKNFDMSSIENCVTLESLKLNYCDISSTEKLKNLKNITTLDLSNNNISSLENLENLENVTTIYLNNNCLYDSELQTLVNLNKNGKLRSLHISGNVGIIDTSILDTVSWQEKDW